ncbi:MAG: hypothetical protein Ta2D_12040 [Rickettsiales bacterium]|nr:MAG: hypothetical protein Ta2D_12040 [Rickettsiales bacterium]
MGNNVKKDGFVSVYLTPTLIVLIAFGLVGAVLNHLAFKFSNGYREKTMGKNLTDNGVKKNILTGYIVGILYYIVPLILKFVLRAVTGSESF